MSRGWKSKPNTNVYCDSTGKSDTDRNGDSDSHSKWDGDTASIGYADSDSNQTDADTKGAAYTASSAHAVTVKELKKLEVNGDSRGNSRVPCFLGVVPARLYGDAAVPHSWETYPGRLP